MTYSNLSIEKHTHIAVVTFNRPDQSNALSVDLMAEISAVAEEFQADIDTRVVIFTGAGKHFSVGVDLKDAQQAALLEGPLLARQRGFHAGPRMIQSLRNINQITIAAVNGLALGGAACIASALDFRIGADDCQIGYPEVNLGIPLSWTSLPLCTHLVGPARAKRMVILGKKESAATLLNWGFLDETAPPGRLLEQTMTMAEAYAAQAPMAAQMIKRSINAVVSAHDPAIMHMDSDQVLLAQSGNEFTEGVEAFLEKRKPEFS